MHGDEGEGDKEKLKDFLPLLEGKRVFLYTGGVKSWSMVFMLEEFRMEVIGTSIKNLQKRYREIKT
ncbi:MAG: hypothetical protein N2Z80_00205 [Hydrogenothermaceae bacterium]|nr:hypothetical protein [Hydrogenothermaceae bacterium]